MQLFLQKSFILDVSLGSEYISDYRLWIRLCLFYYFFNFESMKFRSSLSQMSFKIEVFKNFAIFTRKHLCWSLFVTKLSAYKPATNLLKRDSNTSIFLLILLNFKNSLFVEHFWWLLFKAMFETYKNFTMKVKKAFTKLLWLLYW